MSTADFRASVAELRGYMSSRTYWMTTTIEQRDSAKKALVLSYLQTGDPDDAVALDACLREHDWREEAMREASRLHA